MTYVTVVLANDFTVTAINLEQPSATSRKYSFFPSNQQLPTGVKAYVTIYLCVIYFGCSTPDRVGVCRQTGIWCITVRLGCAAKYIYQLCTENL